MWTGKKDRGRGTAIGVVQDQLSPLLWVALYLPQNPKTRSNTHIAIKIAADGFRPKKMPLAHGGLTANRVRQPRVRQSSCELFLRDCPAHFASCAQAQ